MNIHLNVCKQMTDVKLLLLHSNTWNGRHFKPTYNIFQNAICIIYYFFNLFIY